MSTKIAVIGGGNLGSAIVEGLITSEFCQPSDLIITKRNSATIQHLNKKGVFVTNNNRDAILAAKYIIFAVKPFQIQSVIDDLKDILNPEQHIIISVMTGVWINDLKSMLSNQFTLFRAMPNTAISIGESMTCICSYNAAVTEEQYVEILFSKLGKTVIIEEQLMDAATVLGACGTAFALRFIRANIQGGIEIGFSADTATLIAAQTVKGAADLLLQHNSHPEQEIDKVTTPKGCTIAGLNEMEHQGFSSSLIKGITTSYKKIKSDM